MVDWFVNNKLSLHFGEGETKFSLFSPKHRSKSIGEIDISYKDVKIKQYSVVTYLGWVLDEYLTKVTSELKFYIKKQVSFKRLKEAFV